jgi:hypothetical protein
MDGYLSGLIGAVVFCTPIIALVIYNLKKRLGKPMPEDVDENLWLANNIKGYFAIGGYIILLLALIRKLIWDY